MTLSAKQIIAGLRGYGQADEDGVMCIVSRQAVEEAIAILEAMQPRPIAEAKSGEVVLLLRADGGEFVEAFVGYALQVLPNQHWHFTPLDALPLPEGE